MILSFTIWLQSTSLFEYIRLASYVYAALLALHLSAISLFGGMVIATDLRLLGWAMRGRSISALIDELRVPKRWGFLITFVCGFLLFGSKAEEYYYNVFFRAKISLLALIFIHGLIFRRSVYARAKELDQAPQVPRSAKFAAALSLILWLGVLICGRGIGYIELPFGLHAFHHKTALVSQNGRAIRPLRVP